VAEHDMVEQAGAQDGQARAEVVETQAGEAVVDDLTLLRQELEQARAQASEYLDGWQRARAELANARKRMERELAEERASANARLILKILPVLDDFDRAVENLPPELQGVGWVEGILLIQRKLHQILEAEGLREIAAEGQPFDPAYHEAVAQSDDSRYPEGTVTHVARKGYLLGERVLRPALVHVATSRETP
jgi:molecular chaperone GrpE